MSSETSEPAGDEVPVGLQIAAMRTAIANLRQEIESANSDVSTIRALRESIHGFGAEVADTMEQARSQLQLLQGAATQSESIKTAVERDQAEVATKSQYIEDAKTHAGSRRIDLDRFFTEAEQSAANSELKHQASLASSDSAAAANVAAQTAKGIAEANADSVGKLLQQCESYALASKKLADISDATEIRIAAYESRLADFEKLAAERFNTIDSLLPGAASAGLASAFGKRRAHFTVPQVFWQFIFLAALGGLIVLAAMEFRLAGDSESDGTWQTLGLSLLHRLPFALPLIWLAIHASHKSALAQRVQEDYAFKETVSRSFEGYRREMTELKDKAEAGSALMRYCEGVLAVITNPPGRIYEKHGLGQTPLNALAESAGPLAEAASRLTSKAVGADAPGIAAAVGDVVKAAVSGKP